MGLSNSPLALAAKMNTAAAALGGMQAKATGASALLMKRAVLDAASGRPRKRGGWVRYKVIPTPTHSIAEVELVGGAAHLAERGSYKKPGGWDIKPKRAKAIRTPYGPRAKAHHGPLSAQPFWNQGVNQAIPQIMATYRTSTFTTLSSIF